MTVFGSDYSDVYDLLYRDKDYDRECDLVTAHAAAAGIELASVLDLGCGTGGHALELARRGVAVVGVDRSESMIDRARERAAGLDLDPPPSFLVGDLRTVELRRSFDAATMMFAVLGYQLRNDDLLAALRAARRHLAPGGLLVFDVWYGPAVLAERPSDRVKVVREGQRVVVRAGRARLDVASQVCEVRFEVLALDDSGLREFAERHEMRFFFPRELELALRVTGFEQTALRSFDDPEAPADETTWSVLVTACAVDTT